jgi:dynein heavy chain, axonemal
MLKRLWVHECMRVFADRLISDEDKQLFIEECLNTKDTAFTDMSKIGKPENLLFCNFAHSPDTETVYDEVTDLSTLPHVLESIQTSYNESKGNRDRLDLLFFDYMIHHLARVSRIIMKPQGNGLLIGLSGNGRRSVSRLAIYIN